MTEVKRTAASSPAGTQALGYDFRAEPSPSPAAAEDAGDTKVDPELASENKVYVLAENVRTAFFPFRGCALNGEAPSRDKLIADLDLNSYVRLDATRATPRGQRDTITVLILAEGSKYAHHTPDLRQLLQLVDASAAGREDRLDEVIIVAPEEFFGRGPLKSLVHKYQANEVPGRDREGVRPFYNVYPYSIFARDLRSNKSVPPHRIMSAGEVEEFLRRSRLPASSLPILHARGDAPDPAAVWLGARPGDFITVDRLSDTTGYTHAVRAVH